MKPYKGFILDDQPELITELEEILAPHQRKIAITARASTLEEARQLLAQNRFDISFLDIEIGYDDCFQLFEYIPIEQFGIIALNTKHHTFQVPINQLTAKHQYIQLFKPYTPKKIAEMVREFLWLKNVSSGKKDIKKEMKKIIINDKGVDLFIHPSDIICIEPHSNMYLTYCYIDTVKHRKSKTISAVRGTLADLEEILPPFFYRISRKCLLNTNFIEKINDNEITLTISCDQNKPVTKMMSLEKKKGLFELISLNA